MALCKKNKMPTYSFLLTLAGPKHFVRISKIMARQTRNKSLWYFVCPGNKLSYVLCPASETYFYQKNDKKLQRHTNSVKSVSYTGILVYRSSEYCILYSV